MQNRRKYNKEELNDLINIQKLSYREIGRRYHVSDTMIKKVARSFGIILSIRSVFPENFVPYTKGRRKVIRCLNCSGILKDYFSKKFCCRECSSEYRGRQSYSRFLESDGLYMDNPFYNPRIFKKYFLQEQNNRCAICGIEPIWYNEELVFVLDHIDGHCTNNKRSNIRMLCPNCDSQLDTYKSKNRHSDRTERYKKQRH